MTVGHSLEKGDFTMRRKIFAVVSIIFTVVALVAIWMFSAQGAAESSKLSGGLASFLSGLPVVGDMLKSGMLEPVLRKIAHGTIFAFLGVNLVSALLGLCSTKKAVMLTLIFGVLYAMLDEFHQSFVPGRGPRIQDVMIDACGVILGILVGAIFYQKFIAPKNPDRN